MGGGGGGGGCLNFGRYLDSNKNFEQVISGTACFAFVEEVMLGVGLNYWVRLPFPLEEDCGVT